MSEGGAAASDLPAVPLLSARPTFLQLLSVVGVGLGLVIVYAVGGVEVVHAGWMWTGAGIILALEILAIALPWDRADGWVVVIPVGSILAFGLFRAGTGGSNSLFAVLVLLPLLWIASRPGRGMIGLAAGAVVVASLAPQLIGTEAWSTARVVDAVFVGLVYTVVATAVNLLARDARIRLREARAAEADARSLWEAIVGDAVIATDLDGNLTEWGPGATRLLGDPPVGSLTDVIVPDVSADDTLARLGDLGQAQGGDDAELLNAAGERVPVFVTASHRLDGDGNPIGYLFVARDARPMKEVEQLKDQFVGNISHELRTPLGSILGYLELVREDGGNLTDEQQQYLGVAERNAKRLLQLVGDLLFISQVEGGRLPLEIGEVDLGVLVAASSESIRPVAERAGVTVTPHLSDARIVVPGDERRLGQAIDNLVSNAVKFTPAGGAVTVSARTAGSDAVISVTDTGMGIAPDELDRLSERFFRTRTASRQAIQGVGLGLSITKAIAMAHGGALSASSVVGEGTTFEIRLPSRRRPVDAKVEPL